MSLLLRSNEVSRHLEQVYPVVFHEAPSGVEHGVALGVGVGAAQSAVEVVRVEPPPDEGAG